MIALLVAAAVQSPEPIVVNMDARDYLGLPQQTHVVSGTCDGVPSSAAITLAYRGATPRIELRHGDNSRDIPNSFAEGLLTRVTAYQAALGCDGKRLKFVAHVVQMNGGARVRYFTQEATWDFGTGALVIADPVAESPEEFAAHVQ